MRITRRQLLSMLLAGTAGLALTGPWPAAAAPDRMLRLAASPTGDPGDWTPFTKRTGWGVVPLAISDDSASIRSLLQAESGAGGSIDLLYALGGINRTLITNGLVEPIDTDRLKNWPENEYIQTHFAQGTEGFDYIAESRRVYSVPTVLQGDSFAYLPEVTGKLNSYAALFDQEWAGRVAIEDNVWSAGLKTALYLKKSGRIAIGDPANMKPGEIRAVVDFLIERKRDGQFLKLWSSPDEAAALLASKEAVVVECGEHSVAAAGALGVNAVYAAPTEGFLLWALTVSIVSNPERDAATTQAAYDLIDFLLGGWYGTTIGLARGFLTNPQALAYVEQNADHYTPDQRVKIQALDSAGRLKFQRGGVWRNRWPEHRQEHLQEWERLKQA